MSLDEQFALETKHLNVVRDLVQEAAFDGSDRLRLAGRICGNAIALVVADDAATKTGLALVLIDLASTLDADAVKKSPWRQ